ncbi:MAG: rRNA maturation RNase YbeY [Acidobacteriaceae bacterium]
MLHAMIIVDPEADSSAKGRTGAEFTLPALRSFLRRARQAVPVAGQVSVWLASDSAVQRLNEKFRGLHHATDVLSFPALEIPAQPSISGKRGSSRTRHPAVAGDLAISLDTAARQATQFGHPLLIELKILMLHGLLHLAGYDHETDGGEMAGREEQLRRRFRLPRSLIARSVDETVSPRKGLKEKSVARKTGTRNIVGGKRAAHR